MDEIIISEANTGSSSVPEEAQDKKIRTIADALISSKILLIPASTIYGISCRYDDRKALNRIYKIKRRRPDMPFIVLISNTNQLEMLVKDLNITAKKLIEQYWKIKKPRPLTLILRKNDGPVGLITDAIGTIAVRMAGLKVIRDIISLSGPIVSTSATLSGTSISPKDISAVPSDIRENMDMVVRLKNALNGTESTIVDVTGNTPILIREGALSFESILREL
ncbi:MAG TPA: threonylcarbamoyl-AMP synthase [Actinobacteria bacterium]|nr:threonylcarbamoyl-AMP synthase [Actinomycetota bacterium]